MGAVGIGNEHSGLLISYMVPGRETGCHVQLTRCGDDAIIVDTTSGRLVLLDEGRIDLVIKALERFKLQIGIANRREERAKKGDGG